MKIAVMIIGVGKETFKTLVGDGGRKPESLLIKNLQTLWRTDETKPKDPIVI